VIFAAILGIALGFSPRDLTLTVLIVGCAEIMIASRQE
jgi:hypothetical protein